MRKAQTLAEAAESPTSTRDRILDAAARIFRDKGYADTTMNDLASALNMKAASIYYHFKSKDEIVEHVLNEGTARVFRSVKCTVAQLPDDVNAKVKIRAAIREHLHVLHSDSDYTAANVRIFPEAPRDVVKRHMVERRLYSKFWVQLIELGKKTGEIDQSVDSEMAHMFIVGAMNWSTQWYLPKIHSVDDMSDAVDILVSKGLFTSRP